MDPEIVVGMLHLPEERTEESGQRERDQEGRLEPTEPEPDRPPRLEGPERGRGQGHEAEGGKHRAPERQHMEEGIDSEEEARQAKGVGERNAQMALALPEDSIHEQVAEGEGDEGEDEHHAFEALRRRVTRMMSQPVRTRYKARSDHASQTVRRTEAGAGPRRSRRGTSVHWKRPPAPVTR